MLFLARTQDPGQGAAARLCPLRPGWPRRSGGAAFRHGRVHLGDETALRCRKHHPRRSSKPAHVIRRNGVAAQSGHLWNKRGGKYGNECATPLIREVGLSHFCPGQDFPSLLPQTCDSYFSRGLSTAGGSTEPDPHRRRLSAPPNAVGMRCSR